jgi:uncharacterized membrane protein
MTADVYINRVLAVLPTTLVRREQIALELRGHIAERVAAGHSIDDVLQQLGDPIKLAESYLAAVPLQRASFLSRAAAKIADVAIALIVSGVLVAAIFAGVRRWELLPFGVFLGIIAGGLLFGV